MDKEEEQRKKESDKGRKGENKDREMEKTNIGRKGSDKEREKG